MFFCNCIQAFFNNYQTSKGIFQLPLQFTFSFLIIIFQRLMSTVLLEIVREISQYFDQSTLKIVSRQSHFNFQQYYSEGKMHDQEKILIKQLESLKMNVENLFQQCQYFENENKVLKRIISRSNQTLSTYSYLNGQTFVENLMNKKQNNKYFSKVQNQVYFFEISRGIQNCQKISDLKKELAGLSDNLKVMTRMFDKYELDSTNFNESKDYLVNECSLNNTWQKRIDNQYRSQNQQIGLQTLLCHEELSFDREQLQKKQNTTEYSEIRGVVDSLIAKGIEFRQSRALMSKEFKNLSSIIQQYRSEFKPLTSHHKATVTFKYR